MKTSGKSVKFTQQYQQQRGGNSTPEEVIETRTVQMDVIVPK